MQTKITIYLNKYRVIGCLVIITNLISNIAFAQSNPVAQALPYFQDFSSLAHASTTYPAGIQGWQLGTSSLSSFRTSAATADRTLTASSTASTNAGNVHNYNGKIGILSTVSLDVAIGLAINTTDNYAIEVSYDIMTIRNPYDGSTNTRINEIALQYRVGVTGDFTTLNGTEYQNNLTTQTSGTNGQNSLTRKIFLPSGCNNESIVQLRWAQRDVSGAGVRPSFAIDNISITGRPTNEIYINNNNIAVTENFNNFLGTASTFPVGWNATFAETLNYVGINNGSNNAGGVYSYGVLNSNEYALGSLRSGGTGNITFIATFKNNTAGVIKNLEILYDFEQWRYANMGGFSITSSGLGSGSLNSINQNGVASGTNGSVSVTTKSIILSGLNIANGNTFSISFFTTNPGGASNGIAIDNFSIKANVPLATSFYQTMASGSWHDTNIWQVSSDNITWTAAQYVPAAFANSVTIRNNHSVNIESDIDVDQLVVESGAELVRKPLARLTIANGAGNDITVFGTLKFQSATSSDSYSEAISYEPGSKILVKSNGIIEANFSLVGGYTSLATEPITRIEYEHNAIFDWNPTTNSNFVASGATFFPSTSSSVKPIFRLSRPLNALSLGGASPTVINGVFEANATLTWSGSGDKIFRDGIKGTAIITQDNTCGQFIISGENAELAGTATLQLAISGLVIAPNASVILLNNKEINGGPIQVAGTFDLSDKEISGTYSSFTVSGNALIKTAHVNGLVSTTGSLRGITPTYNFNVSGTTVEYYRNGSQTITSNNYHHLVLSGSGNKILAANTNIFGNISWLNNAGTPILKCGSFKLEVRGNWDNNSSNEFDAENGSVYLGQTNNTRNINGSNNFNILRTFGNLTVAQGTQQNIFTLLELATGVFNTNGSVTLKSTASNTAYIDDFSSGFGGTITGNLTIERYIKPVSSTAHTGRFHFIGGLTGGDASKWSDDFTNGATTTTDNTLVTPTANCDVEFLAAGSAYGNLLSYDETAVTNCNMKGWRVRTTSAPTPRGKGFAAQVTGGTVIDETGNYTKLDYTATLSVTSTNTTASRGEHHVANPFWAPVEWSAIKAASTNIYGTAYRYNPEAGVYNPYNSLTASGVFSTNEAFVVLPSNNSITNYTLNIPATARVNSSNNEMLRSQQPYAYAMKVKVAANGEGDETMIAFDNSFTDAHDDAKDAKKLMSGYGVPSIYTIDPSDNETRCILALPEATAVKTIPLSVRPQYNGIHEFTFEGLSDFPNTSIVWLEDLTTGTIQYLKQNNTYSFTANKTDNADRFLLHFAPEMLISSTQSNCDNENGSISLEERGGLEWSYELVDNNNATVSQNANFSGNQTIAQLPSGTYTLNLNHTASGYQTTETVTIQQAVTVSADMVADNTTVNAGDMVTVDISNTTGATNTTVDMGDGTVYNNESQINHIYTTGGTYTVTLNANNENCSDAATLQIRVEELTTSIADTETKGIKVYANANELYVEQLLEKGDIKAKVDIYNMLGQIVTSLDITATYKVPATIVLTDVAKGTYIAQVTAGKKTVSKRIVMSE